MPGNYTWLAAMVLGAILGANGAETPRSVPDRLVRGGVEAAGPATRRGPIVLAEIHAAPAARSDGRDLRFIELYNSNPYPQRMGGWKLSGSIAYTFPAGYKMPGLSRLVIAPAPADVETTYGISGVLAADPGASLSFPVELALTDEIGAELFAFKVKDADPWPAGISGTGHSLVLARPTYGQTEPAAWARSALPGGSPGSAEPAADTTYSTLLVNELVPHSPTTRTGVIELINIGDNAVSLAGCRLVAGKGQSVYTFPADATLAAHQLLALDEATLGFAVSGNSDAILLRAPLATGDAVIDAIRLPAVPLEGTYGRSPDGGPRLAHLAVPTPGTRNAERLVPPVVLNEIMYHPLDEDKEHEYVELFNPTTNAVDLAGWVLSGDIDYDFTETLPAGGHLVVVAKRSAFRALYPTFDGLLGNDGFSGSLPNGTGTVRLRRPMSVWDAATSNVVTALVLQEDVTYRDGGAWGAWADGGGSSLERIDPRGDPRLAASWSASDETRTCGWKTIATTGPIEYGRTGAYGDPCQVELGLQGAGECLVDSVALQTAAGPNLVANPSFEDGTASWKFHGTHATSAIERDASADDGSRVLHVRAVGRLHTGGNGIRGTLSRNLPKSGTGTISLRVRWLGGAPDLLARARGNWIETFGDITTTHAFGTPGRANSRAGNAAPAILDVTHEPLLPRLGEAITVYARVADPDGLATVRLSFHADGNAASTRTMAPCEGGWYAASIPSGVTSSANPLVAFTVTATDAASPSRTATFPSATPARECLVRAGEPLTANTFGVYRFWITAADLAAWQARSPDSNAPVPVTFVAGNDRVIYTAGIQYGGSPFHCREFTQPIDNGFIDYKLDFPADEPFLDDDGLVLASDGNSGNDPTVAKEQFCYALARRLGLPNIYRRFVHLYANGTLQNARGIMEDTEKPNGAMIDHWFPTHTDGRLYKVDDWFEYAVDDFGSFSYDEKGATLEPFMTVAADGSLVHKLARYRWNWLPRACGNFEANDYAAFFGLVDAVNDTANANYERNLAETLDLDGFIGIPALQQFVGNYDAYGKERGKNAYIYDGPRGWTILGWDFDTSFGADNTRDRSMTDSVDPLSSSLKLVDPAYRALLSRPVFARACWRKTLALVAACTTGSDELVEYRDRYNALAADGVPVRGIDSVLANIQTRRANVLNQIDAANAHAFTLTSPTSGDANHFVLAGEAPFDVAAITCNGMPLDVTWTSARTWSASFTLSNRTQPIILQALREDGSVFATTTATLTCTDATLDALDDHLVLAGLLTTPAPGADGYVEIYNTSTNTTFDLGGVSLAGAIAYTFAPGTLLAPGATTIVYGTFPAHGSLRLVRAPHGLELAPVLLDQIEWGGEGWPTTNPGQALRLLDPKADNALAASWGLSPEVLMPQGGRDLVPLNALWRHSTTRPADGWQLEGFDDAGWALGPGPLGHDTNVGGLPIDFGTDFGTLDSTRATYYFRTTFLYTPAGDQLVADNVFPENVPPDIAARNYLVHRWSFNGTLNDSAGGQHATRCGSTPPAYTDDLTGLTLAGGAKGTSWIDLGANALPGTDTPTTIELWATQLSPQNWSRVLDFGDNTTDYLIIAWTQATTLGTDSVCVKKIADDFLGHLAPFTLGTEFHISVVFQPCANGSWNVVFRKKDATTGVTLGSCTVNSGASGWKPSLQGQSNCWLGHSLYNDNDANATYNEVRIWNAALSDAQLTRNVLLGPDQLPALADVQTSGHDAHDTIAASYLVDDCAVVYLNGTEIQRSDRTPSGTLTDDTLATTYTPQELEGCFLENFAIDPTRLHSGLNTLAVEVHQNVKTSSDIALGFRLTATNSVMGSSPPGHYVPDPDVQLPPAVPAVPTPPFHGEDDIRLNEFMAQNARFVNPLTGAFDDWFELYNNGTNPVSLAGWIVTDTLKTTEPPTPSPKATKALVLPAGVSLAPGEALRVWTGADDASLLPYDAANLQAPFGLSKSADAIYLFDPATNLVDSVVYSTTQSDTASCGRWPNGTGEWTTFASPTPGAANHPARFETPLLVGDNAYTLCLGTPFTSDLAPESTVADGTTFVLVPETGSTVPNGLTVDPSTGALAWTTTGDLVPGVYFLYLCSAVDGEAVDALPLAFTVLSPAADALIAVGLDARELATAYSLRLNWQGRRDATYTVEWCDDLATADWQPFPQAENLIGAEGAMSCTLDLAQLGPRKPRAFFRLREHRR